MLAREVTRTEIKDLRHGQKWIRDGKVKQVAIDALAASLKALGQQIPIIIWDREIIDGNCRFLAAQLAGITHLDAVVLDHEPADVELLEIQYGIDARRESVPLTQRAKTLACMHELIGCTISELAKRTGDSQSFASKLLTLHRETSQQVKDLVDAGRIDIDKACTLKRTTEPALLEQAPSLTREQLRRRVNSPDTARRKTRSLTIPLPGGVTLTSKGPEFDLPTLLEWWAEAIKQVRAAMRRGHDLASIVRYMQSTVRMPEGKRQAKGD